MTELIVIGFDMGFAQCLLHEADTCFHDKILSWSGAKKVDSIIDSCCDVHCDLSVSD